MARRAYKRPLPNVQAPSQPLKRHQTQSHHEQASAEDEVRQIISRVVRTLPIESLEDAVLSLATTYPVVLEELRWLLRDDEASGAFEVGHLQDLHKAIRIQKRFTVGNVAFMKKSDAAELQGPEAKVRESYDQSVTSREQSDDERQYESAASKPLQYYGPKDSDNQLSISMEQNEDARQYSSGTSTPLRLPSDPLDSDEPYDFDTPNPMKSIRYEYSPSPASLKITKTPPRRVSSGKSSPKTSTLQPMTILFAIDTIYRLMNGEPEGKKLFKRRWGVEYQKRTCVFDVVEAGIKNNVSASSSFEHSYKCLLALTKFLLRIQDDELSSNFERCVDRPEKTVPAIINVIDNIVTFMTREEKDKVYNNKTWVQDMELLHKQDGDGYYERKDKNNHWVSGSLVEVVLEKCLPRHLFPRTRMLPAAEWHDPYNHRIDDLLDDSDVSDAEIAEEAWFEEGKEEFRRGAYRGCTCVICRPPDCPCRVCVWERKQ